MATKKITITLPEETLASLRSSAAAAGLPLSTYLAEVTAHHARIQDGLAAMKEWEELAGPVDPDVVEQVDRELDRLDALARGELAADGTPAHETPADETPAPQRRAG